jgi:hypothetical protein
MALSTRGTFIEVSLLILHAPYFRLPEEGLTQGTIPFTNGCETQRASGVRFLRNANINSVANVSPKYSAGHIVFSVDGIFIENTIFDDGILLKNYKKRGRQCKIREDALTARTCPRSSAPPPPLLIATCAQSAETKELPFIHRLPPSSPSVSPSAHTFLP